jgi:hypothetical protein
LKESEEGRRTRMKTGLTRSGKAKLEKEGNMVKKERNDYPSQILRVLYITAVNKNNIF